MLVLKYLLVILGIGLFGSSGALVVYDVYLSSQLRRLLGRRRDKTPGDAAGELAGAALSEGARDDSNAEVGRPLRPIRWGLAQRDRKSTRLNSSHQIISYAVFCLKKKRKKIDRNSVRQVVSAR